MDYAKTKSYATLRREDPSFVPPTSANASTLAAQNGKVTEKKRQRDEELADGERRAKREKPEEDEEEMEIDDEEEPAQPNGKYCTSSYLSLLPAICFMSFSEAGTIPPPVQQPSARLLCTNLPQEVTDDVLSVLFQQYVIRRLSYVILFNSVAQVSRLPNHPGRAITDIKHSRCQDESGPSSV